MININDLRFSYGKKVALNNVSLKIDTGEAIILAGANGSGKTTLLRAISGLLLYNQGQITVNNRPVGAETRKKVAYLPSNLSIYDSYRLHEVIKFHSSFYKSFSYQRIGEYSFELDRKVSGLSRGEKTLFFLSLALSTSPDYLLIDDVIHFLDPHLRDIFLGSILQLIEEKKLSLVIASQVPVDIEGIVDRAIVLQRGKIVLDEMVENLKDRFVKIYAKDIPEGLPVVFKREWAGMKEVYVYPYERGKEAIEDVEYLTLSEILRAYIGGEYAQH